MTITDQGIATDADSHVGEPADVWQLPSQLLRRVLSENAARLYRIPLPTPKGAE